LVEIEGDAVFLYAPAERFTRGEIILELVEATYYTFRDTKASFRRQIVCNCKACEMTSGLDLKFLIHFGEYVLNDVAGKVKPLGNPVNTVHRLSKNKLHESTGWNAYVLFTQECLDSLKLELPDLHFQKENYDHIGDVNTFSLNLDKQYNEFISNRKVFITKETADYFVERNYSVSPPVLWEWVNNPKKRSQWLEVSDWNPKERPSGRTIKGATNHCANSNFFENIIDYRPFNYYTSEIKGKKISFNLTGKFDPVPDGTKFTWFLKINSNLPRLIKKLWGRIILKNGLKIDRALNKLDEFLKEEKEIIRDYQ
jgi:hypothetical protein